MCGHFRRGTADEAHDRLRQGLGQPEGALEGEKHTSTCCLVAGRLSVRPAAPKLSAFRGEFDPAWPIIRLLEKFRLVEVLTKADEGWDNHRRRIPRTVVSPLGTATVKAAAKD